MQLTIAVVSTVSAGGWTVYRALLHRRVLKLIDRRHEREHHISQIPLILTSLAEIKRELQPNGGHSLSDKIQRLSDRSAMTEQRMRAMLQSDAAERAFEANAAGEWVWVNRPLIALTGRTSEELLGNGWINAVDPADRTVVVEEWRHACKDRRECQVRFRIGTSRIARAIWVTLHAFPARSEANDRIISYFGFVSMDTMDQRRRADDLRGE